MTAKRFGVCRLTGGHGKLVKSHLLPRAFTKPTQDGAPLLQAGNCAPISTRWDSWYDPGIVTRAGEDILERIDDAAIKELRKHKLVWSGWGGAQALEDEHHHLFMPPAHGVRRMHGVNVGVLRTFCLSLLWRAAVTSRFEFGEVVLPEADVARLGELVMSGEWGPADFYPATMIQLSTLGLQHNLSPFVDTKEYPAVEGTPGWSVDIVRFYLEGLIIHKHARDDGETVRLGSTIIGGADELLVCTITYEHSFQAENFAEVVAHSMFPDPTEPPSRSGGPGSAPTPRRGQS